MLKNALATNVPIIKVGKAKLKQEWLVFLGKAQTILQQATLKIIWNKFFAETQVQSNRAFGATQVTKFIQLENVIWFQTAKYQLIHQHQAWMKQL